MGRMIDLRPDLTAYRAAPEAGEVRGGILLIHEIWGLSEHIKDVADRFADAGYAVVAPDILSGVGITPELGAELEALMHADEETRTRAQPTLRERFAPARSPEFAEWAVPALRCGVDELEGTDGVAGRIGTVGFCFGGTYAFALAAGDARVRAAVPFYGHPPQGTALEGTACPVLAFYGRQDDRLMEGLPELRRSMAQAGVDFTAEVYEDAGHAFFNDTNSTAYREDAAEDAWGRTLEFLAASLARS